MGEPPRLTGRSRRTTRKRRAASAHPVADETEESFRLLVESVKDYAIFMLDVNGVVRTWNPGAERLKGYQATDIIGRHFSVFYTGEDRTAGKPERGLSMALAEGRFEDEGWRVRRDGTLFWANVVITAIYDRHGTYRGFAKVTRNLTERRQAEEERIRLAHAEEAVRLREEFMSIAAHELRTPLNALQLQIATALVMLERERLSKLDTAELARKFRHSHHLTERLGNLISRLLDISRLTAGRFVLHKEPMDLVASTKHVLEIFEERAATKKFEIRFGGPDEATGMWDRLRIEQVMFNLIDNGIKYGGTPIDVFVEADDAVVSVNIVDHGPGISPSTRGKIFVDRFVSEDPAGQGLGLGLYICHKIIEAHGGGMELQDCPGIGAHFRLWLPRRIDSDASETR